MTIIVANWKMYQPYERAIAFVRDHRGQLEQLIKAPNELIIAPSFVCLDAIRQLLKESPIKICAQDCAPFASGAYTGEVDAASLAQLNCTYAIIGHSERRELCGETDEDVATKVNLLLKNNITPIMCIGETLEDYEEGRTLEVLGFQIDHAIDILKQAQKPYCIAYEPIWAIGTGKVPSKEDLENTFEWIFEYMSDPNATLLYGGSVTEKNATQILKTPHVNGLLIGGASCDFQTLKKIVSLA